MKNCILVLLSLCLVVFSCEKEVEPSIIVGVAEIAVSDSGGPQTISFESNMNWTAQSSESWCTISPASGHASIKSTTITLDPNDTYDSRSVTVTITAGSLSKTITIVQNFKLGVLITQEKYDLSSDATTIEVELKANLFYTVIIYDSWITSAPTKGLTSTKHSFNIAKN